MKALFVYQFLTTGGVEAVLRARLDGLESFGISTTIWFLRNVDGATVFPDDDARIKISSLVNLGRHLHSEPYDVLCIIDTEDALSLSTLPHHKPKIIVEAHSPYLENLEYLRSLKQEDASAIFVPTNHQRKVVRNRLRHEFPVYVVPNPLSREFESQDSQFGPRPLRPIVAWIGRFDELKNWKGFIKLASSLHRERNDLEFWMVGRMPVQGTRKVLYDRLKRAGILGSFRWFDNFPHRKIARLYDAVRESGGVVVSTSNGESFGMTIAEAMARKCAVVVPAIGPFTEFIATDREGLFYRPKSMKDAASKVQLLLQDGDLREKIGSAARPSILKKHSSEVALNVMAKSFERVLGYS